MTPYCMRCGKEGNVYPVDYIEPRNNLGYRWILCFSCALEHHRMMRDWALPYKNTCRCHECAHMICGKCEYPASTVDHVDCPYFEEAEERWSSD